MQTNERYKAKPDELAAPKLGIFGDDTDELIYFPKRFNGEDHGGITKKQYLSATKQGWQIVVVNSKDQDGPGIYPDRSARIMDTRNRR